MRKTVDQGYIDDLISKSEIDIKTVFAKCLILSVQLPNGFVIVESSATVDPMNFNEAIAITKCMEKIKAQLWKLEGYKLQYDLEGGD
jgi:hypothetical protein